MRIYNSCALILYTWWKIDKSLFFSLIKYIMWPFVLFRMLCLLYKGAQVPRLPPHRYAMSLTTIPEISHHHPWQTSLLDYLISIHFLTHTDSSVITTQTPDNARIKSLHLCLSCLCPLISVWLPEKRIWRRKKPKIIYKSGAWHSRLSNPLIHCSRFMAGIFAVTILYCIYKHAGRCLH